MICFAYLQLPHELPHLEPSQIRNPPMLLQPQMSVSKILQLPPRLFQQTALWLTLAMLLLLVFQ